MKKRFMKLTALTMAAAFGLASLAGCGSTDQKTTEADTTAADTEAKDTEAEDTEAAGDETAEAQTDDLYGGLELPLCEDKEELTVWLVYSGTVMTDLNEIAGVQKMEELTNVHINWIPVNLQEISEKYGILLASGDFPDIIYAGSNDYPGGFETGIEDGVIYEDMDTLIRNYMPNYMALINSSDEARREATADSGKMLVAKNIVGTDTTVQSEGTYEGLAYRADLLENLGLDVPTTVDGWHDALVAAKESGMEYPFMIYPKGGSAMSLSWGVYSETYMQLDGDTVVCGQATDGYGEYLETMRQWYAEGLIDPNFSTFNFYMDTPASVENNEKLLYSMILSAFTGNNYYTMHMCTVEDEFLQPIVAPAVNEGDVAIQAGKRCISKDPIYITTSCKNPELAAKWIDFQYSQEGVYLNWYGIEGETYYIDEDGTAQFTDAVLNDPDGQSPQTILQQYALNWGDSWLGKHDTSASWKVSTAAAGGSNQELEAVDIWSAPETNIFLTTNITLTDEESSAVTSKYTALQTMIDEYTINYIVGADVESFEEFQKELDQYGLQDVLAVYQAAYDRYLAR